MSGLPLLWLVSGYTGDLIQWSARPRRSIGFQALGAGFFVFTTTLIVWRVGSIETSVLSGLGLCLGMVLAVVGVVVLRSHYTLGIHPQAGILEVVETTGLNPPLRWSGGFETIHSIRHSRTEGMVQIWELVWQDGDTPPLRLAVPDVHVGPVQACLGAGLPVSWGG